MSYIQNLSKAYWNKWIYMLVPKNRMLRNVAAMMFCENPSKFFKRTQVEIVIFPEGRLNNPNNLYEGPVIKGSITQIIDRTLEYLNRMLVMQTIIKPKDSSRSRKSFSPIHIKHWKRV